MGINGALVTSGNTVDLTLARLRELSGRPPRARRRAELRAQIDSLKAHVRQMVARARGRT